MKFAYVLIATLAQSLVASANPQHEARQIIAREALPIAHPEAFAEADAEAYPEPEDYVAAAKKARSIAILKADSGLVSRSINPGREGHLFRRFNGCGNDCHSYAPCDDSKCPKCGPADYTGNRVCVSSGGSTARKPSKKGGRH